MYTLPDHTDSRNFNFNKFFNSASLKAVVQYFKIRLDYICIKCLDITCIVYRYFYLYSIKTWSENIENVDYIYIQVTRSSRKRVLFISANEFGVLRNNLSWYRKLTYHNKPYHLSVRPSPRFSCIKLIIRFMRPYRQSRLNVSDIRHLFRNVDLYTFQLSDF